MREEVLCAYIGVDLPPVGLGNYGCDWFRRFPVTYTHRHTMWQCNDNLSTADDIGHKFGSIACAHRMNLREWTVTSIMFSTAFMRLSVYSVCIGVTHGELLS